jgi:tRNA modification GTPase
VQQTIQIDGVPLHIIDTAGLRDSTDEVERIGIARTWDEIQGADAVIHLHDLAATLHPGTAAQNIAADALLADTIGLKVSKNIPVVQIWNKLDAVAAGSVLPISIGGLEPTQSDVSGKSALGKATEPPTGDSIAISAKTGQGISQLRKKLLDIAGWQSAPEGVFIARERHVQALKAVRAHLELAAQHLAAKAQNLDLLAEELRLAQNALGSITGEFSADDLLGEIFSRFCIGK